VRACVCVCVCVCVCMAAEEDKRFACTAQEYLVHDPRTVFSLIASRLSFSPSSFSALPPPVASFIFHLYIAT
jgi:hypothetical protein